MYRMSFFCEGFSEIKKKIYFISFPTKVPHSSKQGVHNGYISAFGEDSSDWVFDGSK